MPSPCPRMLPRSMEKHPMKHNRRRTRKPSPVPATAGAHQSGCRGDRLRFRGALRRGAAGSESVPGPILHDVHDRSASASPTGWSPAGSPASRWNPPGCTGSRSTRSSRPAAWTSSSSMRGTSSTCPAARAMCPTASGSRNSTASACCAAVSDPPTAIVALRAYLRHRHSLVESAGTLRPAHAKGPGADERPTAPGRE